VEGEEKEVAEAKKEEEGGKVEGDHDLNLLYCTLINTCMCNSACFCVCKFRHLEQNGRKAPVFSPVRQELRPTAMQGREVTWRELAKHNTPGNATCSVPRA